MITLELLCARFTRLRLEDLQGWIAEGHVRPERTGQDLVFTELDVERVRLILELRDDMAVNEEALPVVLSLLDQLYELRRRLRELGVPPEV
jgi:chaperone modulatory protein CbpM